jgi:hypothetical protein
VFKVALGSAVSSRTRWRIVKRLETKCRRRWGGNGIGDECRGGLCQRVCVCVCVSKESGRGEEGRGRGGEGGRVGQQDRKE